MIIQCEKCGAKFNLDETLIKIGGSKVRCSLCKHIFVAYPQEQVLPEEAETVAVSREDFGDMPAEDSKPVFHKEAAEAEQKDQTADFDNVFKETLEEGLGKFEPVSPEDVTGLEKGEKRPAKSPVLTIIFLIILVFTGVGVAIFFWAPELIPDSLRMLKPVEKQVLTDTGVRRLKFSAVEGSFVDTEKVGRVFVIKGTVKNNYPKSRSFILIKGSILDEKGQVVRRKLAYAGNTFSEKQIKTRPLEEINKAMRNRYGMGRKNFNVAPGTGIPFTIVIENLPDNLSEFTIEAVSSSEGA